MLKWLWSQVDWHSLLSMPISETFTLAKYLLTANILIVLKGPIITQEQSIKMTRGQLVTFIMPNQQRNARKMGEISPLPVNGMGKKELL